MPRTTASPSPLRRIHKGEAEVAQAKLRAFGIEAALVDQVEGGVIHTEGEPGVVVEVPAADAQDAQRILTEEGVADEGIAQP